MKKKLNYLILILTIFFMVGCTNVEDTSKTDVETDSQEITTDTTNKNSEKKAAVKAVVDEPVGEETSTQPSNELFLGYKLIEVDGGDLSGHREPNVVVDIGYGVSSLMKLFYKTTRNEPVLSSGRYYPDEAKVPGVESDVLNEGHMRMVNVTKKRFNPRNLLHLRKSLETIALIKPMISARLLVKIRIL
ncbi:MAG: hypothetical protein ACQEXV_24875 [Bacillota bacterium]